MLQIDHLLVAPGTNITHCSEGMEHHCPGSAFGEVGEVGEVGEAGDDRDENAWHTSLLPPNPISRITSASAFGLNFESSINSTLDGVNVIINWPSDGCKPIPMHKSVAIRQPCLSKRFSAPRSTKKNNYDEDQQRGEIKPRRHCRRTMPFVH